MTELEKKTYDKICEMLDRDKQIEEMVKIMNDCCNRYDEQGNHLGNKCYECECWCDTNHICCSYNTKEATALYNAGYRKSTEVAEEIFEAVDEMIEILCEMYGDNIIICGKYAELKKKYTEGGE